MANIAKDKIWNVSEQQLSLSNILISDDELEHTPPIDFLCSIQHELLSSILQAAVDSIWIKGLDKEKYERLLFSTKSHQIKDLIAPITNQLRKMEGFSLQGHANFMQIPAAWRENAHIKPIGNLMWPFFPKQDSSENGLRCLAEYPKHLCPYLTALFLFSFNLLSRGYASYWSKGVFSSSPMLHIQYGSTLRQRLFSSVLPGFAHNWNPIQPLAWVSTCKNNSGLDSEGCPPFFEYLTSKNKIKGTANIRFAWSRAISLSVPVQGYCCITGLTGEVYKSFHLLDESRFHVLLGKLTRKKLPTRIGIVGSMITNDPRHPSIPENQQKIKPNISPNLPGFAIFSLVNPQKNLPFVLFSKSKHKDNTCTQNSAMRIKLFQLKYRPTLEVAVDTINILEHSCLLNNFVEEEKIANLIVEKGKAIIRKFSIKLESYHSPNKKPGSDKAGPSCQDIKSYISHVEHIVWGRADELFYLLKRKGLSIDWGKEMDRTVQILYRSVINQTYTHDTYVNDFISFTKVWRMDQEKTVTEMQQDKKIMAGRAFANRYKKLSRAEKNELQNLALANKAFTSQNFWHCFLRAKKHWPNAYEPLFEQILHLLECINHEENCLNIGHIIKPIQANSTVKVEELFHANDQSDLIYILSNILTRGSDYYGKIKCDFGVLLRDLAQFHFAPEAVFKRWAASIYLPDYPKKGSDNV